MQYLIEVYDHHHAGTSEEWAIWTTADTLEEAERLTEVLGKRGYFAIVTDSETLGLYHSEV